MQRKTQLAATATLFMTVAVTVLRCFASPVLAENAADPVWSTVSLVTAIASVLLLLLCGGREPLPAPEMTGRAAKRMIPALAFTGCCFLASFVSDLATRITVSAQQTAASVSNVFFLVLLISGALAGVFFLLTALTWAGNGKTVRGILPALSLTPFVWVIARIVQYEMMYTAALRVHLNVSDVLLLLSEMFFLLWLARYVSGSHDTMPRLFLGVSLCTGMLAISSCLTRVIMMIFVNEEAFALSYLVAAPDLAIGILALTVGLSLKTFSPEAAAQEEAAAQAEQRPSPGLDDDDDDDDGDEGYVAPLLIMDSASGLPDDEEEADFDADHSSLEFEDLLQRLLRHPEDERN